MGSRHKTQCATINTYTRIEITLSSTSSNANGNKRDFSIHVINSVIFKFLNLCNKCEIFSEINIVVTL